MTPIELKQALHCHIYSGECFQCPLSKKSVLVCSKELETEVLSYIEQLERRALVAENALKKFAVSIDCLDCPFFNKCEIKILTDKELERGKYCFNKYLLYAEKELAEGNNNG